MKTFPLSTTQKQLPAWLAFLLTLFAVFNLAPTHACAQDISQEPAVESQAATLQIEPNAGTWKTWVLTSGSQLRLPPPPRKKETKAEVAELKAMAAQRDNAALDLINFWDAGAPNYRWNQLIISQAIKTKTFLEVARILTLVNVAIYDAMVAAWDSKYTYNRARPSEFDASLTTVLPNPRSPSYPSEQAVAAGAASAVLVALLPTDTQLFTDKAAEVARINLLSGTQYPSDVTAGLELGRAVAALVIEHAKMDGSDVRWTGTVPVCPGCWKGTNPLLPLMGTWKTWAITSGSQFRPPPPPAFDSAQMATELAEVKNFPRTFNTNRAAFFWASAPVYKLWDDVTSQKLSEYRLDVNPPRAARVYALENIAIYDALVACWDAKYTYWSIRPSQLDPTITTLFANPNFPSYVSAHATASGAAAATLAYLFLRDAELLKGQAEEAASSRLWAGIHFRSDNEVGLVLGRSVAQVVIDRAKNDGSQ